MPPHRFKVNGDQISGRVFQGSSQSENSKVTLSNASYLENASKRCNEYANIHICGNSARPGLETINVSNFLSRTFQKVYFNFSQLFSLSQVLSQPEMMSHDFRIKLMLCMRPFVV